MEFLEFEGVKVWYMLGIDWLVAVWYHVKFKGPGFYG